MPLAKERKPLFKHSFGFRSHAKVSLPEHRITTEFRDGKLTISKATMRDLTVHTVDFKTGKKETKNMPFAQPEGATGFPVYTNAQIRLEPGEIKSILKQMEGKVGPGDLAKIRRHLLSLQTR